MKIALLYQWLVRRVKARPKLAAGLTLAVLALVVALLATSKSAAPALSSFEVKRGDMLVSVVEGGTLEAVSEVSIRSEVEGTARIIYIVPEGTNVRKGDLLVELDSSSSQDAVNLQQISVEKAQFALLQAEQQLEIQKSVAESEIQAATLKVEFAQSDLEKFIKGQALQAQRNAQIEITNVLETLQIAQERLDWSEKLYKQGFETKGNLDKDRLTVSQTRLKLEQAQKALWMVETFDNPKMKRSLESALQEAKENLDRVKLQDERKLAQFAADVESQKKTLALSQEKLEREKKQLLATKVYAPQDGLVVYGSAGGGHWSSESMIEEGAVVRNRQEIIKLPDVSEMKVQVKIHESHINQVTLGLPAYVVLDALPDQRFSGVVSKVAPLPDSTSRWSNPDLKIYATEILITDKLPDLKPGVSARAEVMITNLPNVLSVPIQAVTTRKGKPVVFLASAPDEPVPVAVGQYNTKFIQICSGVQDGDRVLLAPPFDTKEKDLGGAIVADDETLPAGATNQLSGARAAGKNQSAKGRSRPGSDKLQPLPVVAGAEPAGGSANRERSRPRADDPRRAEQQPLSTSLTNQTELLRRFDADGDGKLSAPEEAAMQRWVARRRGTNAPPNGPLVD
jgi:HlyD family secretion protein